MWVRSDEVSGDAIALLGPNPHPSDEPTAVLKISLHLRCKWKASSLKLSIYIEVTEEDFVNMTFGSPKTKLIQHCKFLLGYLKHYIILLIYNFVKVIINIKN
jgi:hypothetical protein